MADSSTNSGNQGLVLAFYILIDVSFSMQGDPIDAVNMMLPEIIDSIEASPTLGDLVRLGAIDFADDAHAVLRLGDLRDVHPIPQFTLRGGTSFAAAFRQLRKEIESDYAQLKGDGYKAYRPAVFFITDGEPIDDQNDINAAFAELTDPSFRARPNIIPFGVGGATKEILEPWVFPKSLESKKPMRSYVYQGGGSAADAIRQIAEVLIGSIVASANSVNAEGSAGGFIPPDDEELDDWI
jgi:uncharacterized protein YegL